MNTSHEPTNVQLLEAIQGIGQRLERHVTVVEDGFLEVNETIHDLAEHMDKRFDAVDKRFDGVERRVTKVEASMVTKSYLDDKLADRRGDLVGMLRTEDQKVNRLVGVLSEKSVLSSSETKDVLSFRLFS